MGDPTEPRYDFDGANKAINALPAEASTDDWRNLANQLRSGNFTQKTEEKPKEEDVNPTTDQLLSELSGAYNSANAQQERAAADARHQAALDSNNRANPVPELTTSSKMSDALGYQDLVGQVAREEADAQAEFNRRHQEALDSNNRANPVPELTTSSGMSRALAYQDLVGQVAREEADAQAEFNRRHQEALDSNNRANPVNELTTSSGMSRALAYQDLVGQVAREEADAQAEFNRKHQEALDSNNRANPVDITATPDLTNALRRQDVYQDGTRLVQGLPSRSPVGTGTMHEKFTQNPELVGNALRDGVSDGLDELNRQEEERRRLAHQEALDSNRRANPVDIIATPDLTDALGRHDQVSADLRREADAQQLIDNLRQDLINAEETPAAPAEVVDQNQELRNLVAAQNVVIEGMRAQMEALNATLQELIAQRNAPVEQAEPVINLDEEVNTPEDNRTPQERRTELRTRRDELLGNLANENDPARRQEILIELRAVMDGIDQQAEEIELAQAGTIARQAEELEAQAARIRELETQLAASQTANEDVAQVNGLMLEQQQRAAEMNSSNRRRKVIAMLAGIAAGGGAVAFAPAALPVIATAAGTSLLVGYIGKGISGAMVNNVERQLANPNITVAERTRLNESLERRRRWKNAFDQYGSLGFGGSLGVVGGLGIKAAVAQLFGAKAAVAAPGAVPPATPPAVPPAAPGAVPPVAGPEVIPPVTPPPGVEVASGSWMDTGLSAQQVNELGWRGGRLAIDGVGGPIGTQQGELVRAIQGAGVDLTGSDSFANWQKINGFMRTINAAQGHANMADLLPQALKLFGK